jgi:alkylated DNA repair dioxygenase AlkB
MITGLHYYQNAVTYSLGDDVLDYINSQTQWEQMPGGRRMLQFGYKHDYVSNHGIIDNSNNLPTALKYLQSIIKDKCKELGLMTQLDNCFVNSYVDNQEIHLHKDPSCFGSVIGCFSFYYVLDHGRDTYMTFSKTRKMSMTESSSITHKQIVEHCSLYIMSGESRYEWKHGLLAGLSNPANYKRISVGFSDRPPHGNKF